MTPGRPGSPLGATEPRADADPVPQHVPQPPSAALAPSARRHTTARDLPPSASDRRLWQIRWVRDLLGLMAVLFLLWLASQVQAVLIPVLVGLALAYAFNPLISLLAKRFRTGRWVPTAGVVAILAGLFIGLLAYLVPPLAGQTAELVNNTPRYARRLMQDAVPFYNRVRDYLPGASLPGPVPTPATQPTVSATDAVTVLPGDTPESPAATAPATQARSDSPALTGVPMTMPALDYSAIGSLFLRSLNVGLTILGSTFSVLLYLVLAGIVTAFCFVVFSARFDRITAWLSEFIPVDHRPRAHEVLRKMDRSVSSFIRGRMIQCAVLGSALSIGWWVVGVPYWLLLGIVSGFLNLIPYASSIGLPIALLLCWVDSTSAGHQYSLVGDLVLPAVVYIVAQQTDNWVVEPLVQGRATNLDPLSVLLAVLIGGTLLGLLGMLIAIPVTACLKILAQELLIPRLRAWARQPGPA